MPFRAESSSFRAYSARKPFPFHVCTMNADGSGNKRLTEKSENKKSNNLKSRPIYMLFSVPKEGYFLETQIKWAGGKLRSLQKNQFVFSTTCQCPPLSGPTRLSIPSAFILAICFSTALGVMPIRSARAAALSELS